HRPLERWKHALGLNPSRHGFKGWLTTEKAKPEDALADARVRRLLAKSIRNVLKEFGLPSEARLDSLGDPNDWRVVVDGSVGARYTPLTGPAHHPLGTRELA